MACAGPHGPIIDQIYWIHEWSPTRIYSRRVHLGGSFFGDPNSWMVYFMENPKDGWSLGPHRHGPLRSPGSESFASFSGTNGDMRRPVGGRTLRAFHRSGVCHLEMFKSDDSDSPRRFTEFFNANCGWTKSTCTLGIDFWWFCKCGYYYIYVMLFPYHIALPHSFPLAFKCANSKTHSLWSPKWSSSWPLFLQQGGFAALKSEHVGQWRFYEQTDQPNCKPFLFDFMFCGSL